jgi:copper(I)-binding protein
MGEIVSKHLRIRRIRVDDRSRRAMLGVCVLVLVGALAGCGGGSSSSGRRHTGPPARPGAAATSVGGIELQHVRIERPAGKTHAMGSDVGLYLTIVNRRAAGDRLRAVTTPDATRVVMREGVSSPAQSVNLPVPKHATLSLQHPDKTHLELSGLKHELRRGEFVPLLFSFEHAGSVKLDVPVPITKHPVVPSPTSSRSG